MLFPSRSVLLSQRRSGFSTLSSSVCITRDALRLAEREAVADQRPRVHLAPFRLGTASTTITSPAPKSRAPTVAIGPTGPWAETATVPPPGMLAYSLP